MKGEKVIVRARGNKALLKTIWDSNDRLVYIVNNDEYDEATSGNKEAIPVGFPIEDVFIYNTSCDLNKINWENLENWKNG